nr:HigA family addiction module antitoxin [Bifidobacterium aerophilum]
MGYAGKEASVRSTDDYKPGTPGEVLQTRFLTPNHITKYRLAQAMNVPPYGIGEIIQGKRRITLPMAIRLAYVLGTTPEYWLDLQRDYDLKHFDVSRIRGEVHPLLSPGLAEPRES